MGIVPLFSFLLSYLVESRIGTFFIFACRISVNYRTQQFIQKHIAAVYITFIIKRHAIF